MGAEIPVFEVNISFLGCMLYSKCRHGGWGPSLDPGVCSLSIHGVLIPHSQALHFPSQHTDKKKSLFLVCSWKRSLHILPTHSHTPLHPLPNPGNLCPTPYHVIESLLYWIWESLTILWDSKPCWAEEGRKNAHTGLVSCWKAIRTKMNSLMSYQPWQNSNNILGKIAIVVQNSRTPVQWMPANTDFQSEWSCISGQCIGSASAALTHHQHPSVWFIKPSYT